MSYVQGPKNTSFATVMDDFQVHRQMAIQGPQDFGGTNVFDKGFAGRQGLSRALPIA
jgi:hypothetical protein